MGWTIFPVDGGLREDPCIILAALVLRDVSGGRTIIRGCNTYRKWVGLVRE